MRIWKHTAFMAGLAMSTALVLGGVALAEEPVKGGTLRILATGEPDHIDPTGGSLVNTNNLARAISRQLISYESSMDPDVRMKPVGDLAVEVPQPTDDGLTYTFKLRQGINWNAPSGARPLVAQDMERGMKKLCNPQLQPSTLSYFTDLIVGLSEFCDGFSKVEPTAPAIKKYIEDNDVAGIQVPDDQTIVIKLKERAGDFVYMLSLQNAAPAPIEALEYLPDSPEYRANFVGLGPYVIGEYVPDTTLKLVRNPVWNAEADPLRKAYADEIEITMGLQADAIMQQLQAGDADLAYDINVPTAVLAQLTAMGDEKLNAISSGNTNFIFINTITDNNNGALKDLRVRQALQYAVDKAAVAQTWGGAAVAEPVNGIFGLGVLGHHKFDLYPSPESKGDPEKAKALLAEAGFPNGITLKMPYRNRDLEVASAATIQASMARAGITIELTPVTAADYYSKYVTNRENIKNGVWDIAPVGWTPDWVGGAARSVFQPQFSYSGAEQKYNYTNFNNDKANEVAAQAINATTPEETAKLWAQVDEIVMGDAPVVPLIANKNPRYHSEAVKNYQIYGLGVEGDWTNIWLDR